MNSFLVVFGTRPEIIKLSPVIKALARRRIKFELFFTGQHASASMSSDFFHSLGIDKIKRPIVLKNFSNAKCIELATELLTKHDGVIVQGDTNSALLGALAGRWSKKKVIHVEAGLRSFNAEMAEERNRIIIDELSDYLFVSQPYQLKYLTGTYGKKVVVGNTTSDVLSEYQKAIPTSPLKHPYIFLTLHRPELVDHKEKLTAALTELGKQISEQFPQTPVIFPVHPRTKAFISKFKINLRALLPTVHIVSPLDPFTSWAYIKHAKLIITDSGGIQEESCILNVPCFTLRDDTERPETLALKSNILLGTTPASIRKNFKPERFARTWKHPYGRGVSDKIVNILAKLP